MDHCLRHMEESAAGECRNCHGLFCARCLVYSFGPKKPPFCVGCALHASGVRTGSRRTYQPRSAVPNATEVGTFAGAPALFSDDTHGGPPRPSSGSNQHGPSTAVKASWSERRAQRQAAKARRSSAAAAGTEAGSGMPEPLDGPPAEQLEPVLSANQRRALGRLSAGSFARS